MNQVMKLLAIVALLLLVCAAALAAALWEKWCVYRNAKNPETRILAEVSDRRMVSYQSGRGFRRHDVREYYVTFRPMDGGDAIELDVGESEYRAYRIGDRGPLTYRTWEFIGFRPENRNRDADDVPVAFADDEKVDER